MRKHVGAVIDLAEEGEGESFNKEEGERRALVIQLKACYERLKNESKSAEK